MNSLSKLANLSRIYTNHCKRATTITALSYAGFQTRQIMAVSGYKNESSVRSYVQDPTTEQKRSMSATLSSLVKDDENHFNDGFDDALALSASQAEQILQDIAKCDNDSGSSEFKKTTHASGQSQPLQESFLNVPNVTHTIKSSESVSFVEFDNNLTFGVCSGPSPVFNFHGCNINLYFNPMPNMNP